ncbi:MAG: CRISPR-associated helicase Cas3', partial [Candidatus Helarchaeota archaeon]
MSTNFNLFDISRFYFLGKVGDARAPSPHLLLFHLLDSAAVAKTLWKHVVPPYLKQEFQQYIQELSSTVNNETDNVKNINITEDEFSNLISFICSLHDLGKLTLMFQKKIGPKIPNNKQNKEIISFYSNNNQYLQKTFKRRHITKELGRHANLTYFILRKNITILDLNGDPLDKNGIDWIFRLLSAHHGQFSTRVDIKNVLLTGKRSVGGEAWKGLQQEYYNLIEDVLIQNKEHIKFFHILAEGHSNKLTEKIQAIKTSLNNFEKTFGIFLLGLISVSDWLASNEKFFQYEGIKRIKNTKSKNDLIRFLKQYYEDSCTQAKKVITDLYWNFEASTDRSFYKNINFQTVFGKQPRPLQEVIEKTCSSKCSTKNPEPGLYIIEAPTGEGKSEAAMYLAMMEHLMGTKGCYFALPSMATSNQMFLRIKSWVEKLVDLNQLTVTSMINGQYQKNDVKGINLMLLHGQSFLNEDFLKLSEVHVPDIDDDDGGRLKNSIHAAEWFTFKRRGLLSPFGVGTIDQALMSILQIKYFYMRLFGLAGKTVILDEIHAYDIYMTDLIKNLLTWLGALRCSVILLSATLPKSKKIKLIEAYQKGRNLPLSLKSKFQQVTSSNINQTSGYPEILQCIGNDINAKNFPVSPASTKEIIIKEFECMNKNTQTSENTRNTQFDEQKLKNFFKVKLENGGCAALICNTVKEAQEIYKILSELKTSQWKDNELEIILFHSRFLFKDKYEKEKQIIEKFGKNLKARPKRAIVISTQLIEQSLDVDFDMMVSFHAPIDLILQRIGRLHRHQRPKSHPRPKGLEKPCFYLIKPLINDDGIPNFGPTEYIYDRHVLLRTWLVLSRMMQGKNKTEIKVPESVSKLIENVYFELEQINASTMKNIPQLIRNEYEASNNKIKAYFKQTWEKLQEKTKKSHEISQFKMIKSIDKLTTLDDIAELSLKDEDSDGPSPLHHLLLQATTRLSQPSMNLILITPKEQDKIPKQNTTNTFKKYSKQDLKWLFERSVRISGYQTKIILGEIEQQANKA